MAPNGKSGAVRVGRFTKGVTLILITQPPGRIFEVAAA